jgi:uracil-DNA glycosylase family protein
MQDLTPTDVEMQDLTPIVIVPTLEGWQAAARALLRDGVAPAEVVWREAAPGETPLAPAAGTSVARVPRRFVELAAQAARGRDPSRWSALYAVLWRLVNERRDLLEDTRDPDVRRLVGLAMQARRETEGAESAEALRLEESGGGARPFVPVDRDLGALRRAATRCTGCDLYRHATQVVFGRGPADARIMLVGEQPGDQEDLQGAPFVGPAGEVLDRALGEVGLARDRLYVTNVVKHFKFVQRGKRRIHETPRLTEVSACRPWVEAELDLVAPEVLVCLGATAARALLGAEFRLLRDRGRFLTTRWAPRTIATLHPSAVLRGQDEAEQTRLYGMLVDDLRVVAQATA